MLSRYKYRRKVTQIILILSVNLLLIGCQSPPVGTMLDDPQPTTTLVFQPTMTFEIGIDLKTPLPPTAVAIEQTVPLQPSSTPVPTITPLIYRVQEGDTVAAIAARQGATIETITSLNPGLDPNVLFVGQELLLPTVAASVVDIEAVGTAVPLQIEVVDVQLYPNPANTTWIVGTVKNIGTMAVEDVALGVDLIASDGQTLQSYTTWVEPAVIPSQETAVFAVLAAELPENVNPIVSVLAGLTVDGSGSRYLDLEVKDLELVDENGTVQVSGQIQNSGENIISKMLLVASFYTAQGSITGFHTQEYMLELGPGDVYSFSFDALPPGGTAVTTQIAVQGIMNNN